MNTLRLVLLAGALAVTPVAALAQDIGTTIYGSDGKPVGTVVEINPQVVVIDTGRHKAPVPVSMIYEGRNGKSVNASRALVDKMMEERIAQANAERDAKLVPGAAVVSAAGRAVGTISAADLARDAIILDSAQGPLRFKKEHFAVTTQGQLMVLYSREQIATAANGGSAATGAGS
ncbi:MAG: hypothetical protein O9293_10555 [Porphyrobacter sp.]|nr:hypothetical protein [Porphyrobacter sp.]